MISREFVGPNPLPLSSYISSLADPALSSNGLGLISFIITKSIMSYSLMKNRKNGKIASIIFILISLMMFSKTLPISIYLSEMIVFIVYQSFNDEKYNKVALLLSLLAINDSIYIPTSFFVILTLSTRFFMMATDPRNSVEKTVCRYIKITAMVLAIPVVFLISISSLDLSFRNMHSSIALNYPIPFQASLSKFNVYNGFKDGHGRMSNTLDSTHLYVMDRSVISLLNRKHKVFFEINDTVDSSKEFVEFCEIHKIHEDEFDNEEPRFIKNGDTVKFRHLVDEKYIGIKRTDNDEKFVPLKIENSEDDSDLWEVICDGYLKAWTSEVRFKNLSTGDFLSVRMVKNSGQMMGSYHSEVSSRVFYISSNTNHPFYIESFTDEKARSTVSQFSRYGMMRMIVEYIKAVDVKSNAKIEIRSCSFYKKIIFISVGLGFLAMLIFNDIAEKRYQVFIRTSYRTRIISLSLLVTIMCSIVTGVRPYMIGMTGVLGFLSILSDLIDQAEYYDSESQTKLD